MKSKHALILTRLAYNKKKPLFEDIRRRTNTRVSASVPVRSDSFEIEFEIYCPFKSTPCVCISVIGPAISVGRVDKRRAKRISEASNITKSWFRAHTLHSNLQECFRKTHVIYRISPTFCNLHLYEAHLQIVFFFQRK